MTEEKKTTSKERYDARTAKYYGLKLNKNTDADIIARLSCVESMQGYIKSLIREDIAKSSAANKTDVIDAESRVNDKEVEFW